jgi:integrase
MLIGCGLRRGELLALTSNSIQLREEHLAIADLIGKGGQVRTVPVPTWGQSGADGMTPKVLWEIVKDVAACAGIERLAPHDLRRTCARLCHLAGGELDQIQFLLGHVSIQTTERYLGCKQKLRSAVIDRLGIEPESGP